MFFQEIWSTRELRQVDRTHFFRFGWRYIAKNRKMFSIVNLHAPRASLWIAAALASLGRLSAYVMTLHGLEERRMHVMSREVKKGRAGFS